jgi:carboxymethylenebutenolidase
MCLDGDWEDSGTDRRSFITGSIATIAGLTILESQKVTAQTRLPETRVLDNPTIEHGKVLFKHNGKTSIGGYISRPKARGIYPGVLVIAGNKISEEYIPNTCAALALDGFVGLAPDVFHPLPDDVPSNNKAYSEYLANHTELDRLDDIQSGVSYLRTQPFVSSAGLGVVGFCRGGREAMLFGARSREIEAVIAFHPAPMKQPEISRLKTIPVQIHHGTADESVAVTETKKTETLLRVQGTPVEVFLYQGANHGFLAYTRPSYEPHAAKIAWKRALRFLHRHLR